MTASRQKATEFPHIRLVKSRLKCAIQLNRMRCVAHAGAAADFVEVRS
jgi:hypothetical protein